MTTIRREHVRGRNGQLRFSFPAKSGKQREFVLAREFDARNDTGGLAWLMRR